MSRPSKPKPAPAVAAPETPHPAAPQQPETTGAESAPTPVSAATAAEAAPAPVDPIPEAEALELGNVTGPDGVAVSVTGPARGRWRIGRHFGPTPVVIPLNELTLRQAEALHADPELTCVGVDLTAPAS
jgi:hypothetical protein